MQEQKAALSRTYAEHHARGDRYGCFFAIFSLIHSYSKVERMLEGRFQKTEIVPVQGKIIPFVPVSPYLPKSFTRLFAKDLLWRAKKPIPS